MDKEYQVHLYGFRTAAFRGQTVEEALAAISRAGYRCVELCLDSHGLVERAPSKLRRLVHHAAELGLGVASFSYHGDGQPADERWRRLAHSLELAAQAAVPILVLNGDRASGQAEAAGVYDFLTRALPLAERARASGLRLAVEPEPGLLVANTGDMLRVLAKVPSPPMAVNLDIGHAFLTDELSETFGNLGAHIAHLHLEGIKAPVHKHLLPGEGDIPFAQVESLAADVGYSGPWVIDLFQADADPAATAAEALRRLQEALGRGLGGTAEGA